MIHIAGVCERDIDLLMLEEFVSSKAFLAWFADRVSGVAANQVISVRRSVTQTGGESDIELEFESSTEERCLFLIENKVAAAFQKDQSSRYRQRAKDYLATGEFDLCLTVLIAPSSYLSGGSSEAEFDHVMTYEDIVDWFKSQGESQRVAYKLYLLNSAINKARSGYNPVEDAPVTDFWHKYWKLASDLAPELELPEPEGKPAGAGFVHFRPKSLPKGVHIIHKLMHGRVDLEIAGAASRVAQLSEILEPLLESGMKIVRTNKSVAVRLLAEQLNTAADFDAQQPLIVQALHEAKRLLFWALKNEAELASEAKIKNY